MRCKHMRERSPIRRECDLKKNDGVFCASTVYYVHARCGGLYLIVDEQLSKSPQSNDVFELFCRCYKYRVDHNGGDLNSPKRSGGDAV